MYVHELCIHKSLCNVRLASLAVLSAILLSGSVSASVQGIVAVCAVVAFVISYAIGLGAGTTYIYCMYV